MVIQRRFDKNLGLRHPLRREIVIREGPGLIGIVEEDHRPGAFHVSLGLDQLRGRPPYRRHVLAHERLHRLYQGVEVDPERRRSPVETCDPGYPALVECAECRSCGFHKPSLGMSRERRVIASTNSCADGPDRMLRSKKKMVKRGERASAP